MKAFIYTVYALTVLLFSGFARAHTLMKVVNGQELRSPVQIENIGVDKANLALNVVGHLPTPCHQDPSAVLVVDRYNPNTLILRFLSPYPTSDFCMAKIKDFDTVVDIRQLAKALELSFDNKALYVVRTEGYNFSLEVSGQDLNH